MNFKISSFLIFLFFTSISITHAQKLRDKSVTIKHTQLPYRLTPDSYTTYSVEAVGEVLQISGISAKNFSDDLTMQGFKRVSGFGQSAGHLHLVVDLGILSVGQAVFKNSITKVKDKNGNETSVEQFYYSVPFSGSFNAKVIDPNGKILGNSSGTFNRELSSNKLRDAEVVKKGVNKYINMLTVEAARDIQKDAYSLANSLLQSFDYREINARENLYIIRKHPSENQWVKHQENVKKRFEEHGNNTNLGYLKEHIEDAIEFYKKMASKDHKNDKKLKRIHRAANLNLATIYYYLDDPASTIEYAEVVLRVNEKDARASRIVNDTKKLLKKMRDSGISTIYYQRDLKNAVAPIIEEQRALENREILEGTVSSKAYIVLRNVAVSGQLIVDNNAEDLIFGNGGNVKFVENKDGILEEIDLTNSQVTEINFSNRVLKRMKFAPSAKGQVDPSMYFLEKLYNSERISVFKYYPQSGALGGDKPEFAFQKSGQEYPISLESTMFLLWKKGLAKYFADCPDLAEMASEGGIEKTKDSLIKAARVYSELCDAPIKP